MIINTTPTTPLSWHSAGTDEPGDQHARSRHLLPGATSAYYCIGPWADGCWWLELIQTRQGEQLHCLMWTPRGNEADAKATAEQFERTDNPNL